MVLKIFISDAGEILHVQCSGLLGERALWVDTIYIYIIGRWPWNDCSLVTMGNRLCMFTVWVSIEIEVFALVELFLGDVPWNGRPVQVGTVILGRWSGKGRRLRHWTGGYSLDSLLMHVMVLECMTGEPLMMRLEKGLERKKECAFQFGRMWGLSMRVEN